MKMCSPFANIVIVLLILSVPHEVDGRRRHHSAPSPAISARKSELARLRAQISTYENQLTRLERTEHSSLRKLDAYSRQTHLLRTLIARLNEQEERLTRDIDATQHEISASEQQLRDMKAQYARTVVALYKRGTQGELEMLLTSHNMNEALERSEYLRRFSDFRRRLADNISMSVTALRDQQTSLTEQRDEKSAAAAEKAQQQQHLATQASQRAQLIDKIRADKSSLKQTLTRAKQSSRAIESLIERLVAREQTRKKLAAVSRPGSPHNTRDPSFDEIAHASRSEESHPRGTTIRSEAADGTGFGALRGAMRWPCASRHIAEHYGEHTNPALGTVTTNLGVDIRTPKNSDVYAVAEGTVSLVYWLPSYGTIVILDHQGGYRTVYANLAEVTVKQGDHIRTQQAIGRSDASVEAGEVLHFEIWKDRDKQNPEAWLGRR